MVLLRLLDAGSDRSLFHTPPVPPSLFLPLPPCISTESTSARSRRVRTGSMRGTMRVFVSVLACMRVYNPSGYPDAPMCTLSPTSRADEGLLLLGSDTQMAGLA